MKCRYQMHIEKCGKNVVDPLMPSHIKILVHDIKGCQYIYKTFLGKTNCVNSICLNWERHLHYTPECLRMQKYHRIIFRFTPDIGLRYFQYKIVNRILYLNKQLYKKRIVSNDKCSFCKKELEDIAHFFYNCEISKSIWNETVKWINEGSRLQIEFNLENVILWF